MRTRRAYTLIEAMVATVFTGLAVAGMVGAIGSLSKTNAKIIDKERMHRLAYEKVQEIIATNDYNTVSGDYSSQDLPYSWSADIEPSGAENLDVLTVTISYTGSDRDQEETASTLVYRSEGN